MGILHPKSEVVVTIEPLEQLRTYCKTKGCRLMLKGDSVTVEVNRDISFSRNLKGADKNEEYLKLLIKISEYFFEETTKKISQFIY